MPTRAIRSQSMGDKGDKIALDKVHQRLSSIVSTINPLSNPTLSYNFPPFDDLPNVTGQPKGCLWGFFDQNGNIKDELGTLNLLTPATVRAAAQEIRTGHRVQLDRTLECGGQTAFGRKAFEQKILDRSKISRFYSLDDEISLNTQCSSQWDSLKHFAHQKSASFYNGLSFESATSSTKNGIHNIGDAGGVVGRGVLVDWVRWHENIRGSPPSPPTGHEIPVSDLIETLKYQGTNLRPGDILIVRSGYGRWLDNTSPAETATAKKRIGVQGSEATVRWLYDQHLAAVAGDAVAFEAWPPNIDKGWCLHEWLLVQWGTPIGELWDLEQLSLFCANEGRWSFFMTSAPLRVKGGIGSPPGVIAIF